MIWARQLIGELGRKQTSATKLFVDNQGAIALIRNPQIHARTKHIDIRYMFVRAAEAEMQIETLYVASDERLADPLTKPLERGKFQRMLHRMNMI